MSDTTTALNRQNRSTEEYYNQTVGNLRYISGRQSGCYQ